MEEDSSPDSADCEQSEGNETSFDCEELNTDDASDTDSDDFQSESNLPTSSVHNQLTKFGPIEWLAYALFVWYVKCGISDRALNWLLKILCAFFAVIGKFHKALRNEIAHFPVNFIGLLKFVNFGKQDFSKYIVCPNPTCTKLHTFMDTIAQGRAGQQVSVVCVKCGSTLVNEKIRGDGKKILQPLKIYCYKSISDTLKFLFSRSDFYDNCVSWRTREIPSNSLGDIYDGTVWKSFASQSSLNPDSVDLGLMLNCDWFQPYKRRSNVSVGVLYAVIGNLPWSMRFKPENVLLIGVLPALSKEPSSLNTFLEPAIEELLTLEKGISIDVMDKIYTLRVRIICTSSDIPATRKLCGFLSHSANLGCSKCLKYFPTMSFNGSRKRNYSGFDRDTWTPRTNEQHRSNAQKILAVQVKSKREALEKKLGCRYSVLLQLSYFDPIVNHVVDPMHNLFLGTAKKMFYVWIDNGLLSSSSLKKIESRIKSLPIPSELGRIPTSISSNAGNFTASEWKNWTLVYSLYCLQGLLPSEHLRCWQTFVLACRILCKPLLFSIDVNKADLLLMKFCRTVVVLYGPNVVTPNMHMHAHLVKCIEEYGPIFSFWLFSFERYNGILGSFANNKKNIEVQLMRKFLAIAHSKVSHSKLVNSVHTTSASVLELTEIKDALAVVNEEEAVDCCRYFISQGSYLAPFLPCSSVVWDNTDIHLPSRCTLISLDTEELKWLTTVYRTLFPKYTFSMESLPLMCKKYPYVYMGSERFGHKSCQKKCNILASWANTNGTINNEAYLLRAGEIQHFLHHSWTVTDVNTTLVPIEMTFAIVKWFKCVSDSMESFLPPLIEVGVNDIIVSGPATFLPVKRIGNLLVMGDNHLGTLQTSKIGIPLLRKNITY